MLRFALALLACAVAQGAAAQVARNFPQNALRGKIVVGEAPQITLNGTTTRLAPGARIRDQANLVVVPSSIAGGRYLVNYTTDLAGLVSQVWILTPDEADKSPWPETAQQAQAWRFDPVGQTWTKP